MGQPRADNVTVRRMLLGTRLRKMREARGIGRESAGYAIRASESKMSRLELGRVSFKERDVVDLLDLYQAATDEREAMLELLREAGAEGRWREYEDVLPGWFQNYVALEDVAQVVRTYEAQFVPGLLQTPGYAEAIIGTGVPVPSPDEIRLAVALRVERQKVLDRSTPPHLWAVLDEAALRRPVGGAQVHRDQIKHLITLAERPRIALQILPLTLGTRAPAGGPFSILRFSDPELADVVYVEQLVGALYLDRPAHVERYSQVMDQVTIDSLTPQATLRFLADLLDEF